MCLLQATRARVTAVEAFNLPPVWTTHCISGDHRSIEPQRIDQNGLRLGYQRTEDDYTPWMPFEWMLSGWNSDAVLHGSRLVFPSEW